MRDDDGLVVRGTGQTRSAQVAHPPDMSGAQMFLAAVAGATLEPATPPSLRGQAFLRSLDARDFHDPDALAAEARVAASGPSSVSRARRLVPR